MALASIANVPSNAITLRQWAFSHMAHHRDINRRILETENIAVPEYILDPLDPTDMQSWLYQHQAMHNNQNAILGIAGNNLIQVQWTDPGQLTNWIQLNFREHFDASEILGV